MKRQIVLTNEGAGHPFRRRFAPAAPLPVSPLRQPMSDFQLFLLTFIAGFLAFYGMIA